MEQVSNLAFTSLIFLLLAVPGYLARACYHSGQFTRHLLPRSWTDDILNAILTAFPFHFAVILAFELLHHLGVIHYTLSLEDPLRVLMGQYTDTSDPRHTLSKTIDVLFQNKFYLLTGYSTVILLALVIGHAGRRAVWDLELDVKWPAMFRFKSDWLYELLGRGKLFVPHPNWFQRLIGKPGPNSVPHMLTLVILDAVTDQPTSVDGKTQLYSGVVTGFTLNSDGGLNEIALTKAKRGKFLLRAPGTKLYKFHLEDIPGEKFVLKYSAVKNMNLTYLSAP
ncbi:MAG: hypothetical protein AB7L09_10490 [Nitrospira sp.]